MFTFCTFAQKVKVKDANFRDVSEINLNLILQPRSALTMLSGASFSPGRAKTSTSGLNNFEAWAAVTTKMLPGEGNQFIDSLSIYLHENATLTNSKKTPKTTIHR